MLPLSEMEVTKATRRERAHIYPRTSRTMCIKTENMLALCLRGFERNGHLPTKRTKPTLPKRRYSIDVNTKDWNNQCIPSFFKGKNQRAPLDTAATHSSSHERKYEELELFTSSAPALPFPTPHRFVDFNKWLASNPPASDDVYLQLKTAEISNNVFRYITHTNGPEQWMRDDGLDMALMVLSCDKSCESSSIGIASSVDSQVCRFPDPAGKEDYAVRFGDKRWIFMPVNDGMAGVENNGINGIHWAFVVLDRVHKTAHYFDSLFVNNLSYLNLATEVSAGMLRVLDEDLQEWHFNGEEYSPHQHRDNQCNFDGGACAPFVYSMIDLLIDWIQQHQQAGQEEDCILTLSEEFPEHFRSWFHSYEVRKDMQRSIASAKMHIDAAQLTCTHDKIATTDKNVELLNEPALGFNAPPLSTQSKLAEPPRDIDTDGTIGTSFSSEILDGTVPPVSIQLSSPSDTSGSNKEQQSALDNIDEYPIDVVLDAIANDDGSTASSRGPREGYAYLPSGIDDFPIGGTVDDVENIGKPV